MYIDSELFYSLPLVTFANSLVGPHLKQNSLTLLWYSCFFFAEKKVDFEKNQRTTKEHAQITQYEESGRSAGRSTCTTLYLPSGEL